MAKVTAKCTNTEEMVIAVSAEMAVGQWRKVLVATKDCQYYSHFNDFLTAIKEAINSVQMAAQSGFEVKE